MWRSKYYVNTRSSNIQTINLVKYLEGFSVLKSYEKKQSFSLFSRNSKWVYKLMKIQWVCILNNNNTKGLTILTVNQNCFFCTTYISCPFSLYQHTDYARKFFTYKHVRILKTSDNVYRKNSGCGVRDDIFGHTFVPDDSFFQSITDFINYKQNNFTMLSWIGTNRKI